MVVSSKSSGPRTRWPGFPRALAVLLGCLLVLNVPPHAFAQKSVVQKKDGGSTKKDKDSAGTKSTRPTPPPAKPEPESGGVSTEPGGLMVAFKPLVMDEPVTSMAITEDHRYLVTTHQAADKVSLWDISEGRTAKVLETPSPRNVLCRNDGIYVVNAGRGCITFFSEKKDYEMTRQFEIDVPHIVHISAAQGSAFDGDLYVSCHRPGPTGSYEGPTTHLVSTRKQTHRQIGQHALATASADGKLVATQGSFNLSPSGGIGLFPADGFVKPRPEPVSRGGTMQTPYVYQTQPGSYWIGTHMIFGGMPIQMLKEKMGDILVPDLDDRLVYALTRSRITAHRLNTQLSEVGSRRASFPAAQLEKFEGIFHTIYRHRDYLLDHPLAFHFEGELRLFVLDFKQHVVLEARTPEFQPLNRPAARNASVAPGKKAMPDEEPAPPVESPAEKGQKFAFLVAAADYDRTELKPLAYSRSDIVAFRDELIASGYKPANVVMLHDDVSSLKDARFLSLADNIREELQLLLKNVEADDTLVVAFAGHGVQFAGEADSFFCPRNARLAKRETLVSLTDVLRQMDECPAARKVLFVDACRNNPQSELARSRAEVNLESITRPQDIPAPKSLLTFFSCASGQQSFEDPTLKHGIFFHHVLKGWKGAADGNGDGRVAIEELGSYVRRETKEYARVSLKTVQIPQFEGNVGDEWILRTSPGSRTSTSGSK
jgi:hypothetical protein